jgi:hypothetical protein
MVKRKEEKCARKKSRSKCGFLNPCGDNVITKEIER